MPVSLLSRHVCESYSLTFTKDLTHVNVYVKLYMVAQKNWHTLFCTA